MTEETKGATQTAQEDAVLAKVDEYLGLEEVTIVYRGVRQPQNAAQLSIELAALKHVRQTIDTRISSLEFDFTLHLEKLKLAQAIAKKLGNAPASEAPAPPAPTPGQE